MELPEGIKKYYRLYNGEKVTCTKCGKGTYEPVSVMAYAVLKCAIRMDVFITAKKNPDNP